MPKLLTVEDVARYLNLAPATIYRKARNKEIPAVRIGRTWRFPQDMLEEWIRKKTEEDRGAWKYQKKKGVKIKFGTYRGRVISRITRKEIYQGK